MSSIPRVRAPGNMVLWCGMARLTDIECVAEERKAAGAENDYWLLATLGEAYLNLGDAGSAAEHYRAALGFAGRKLGDIASMRSNVMLLAAAIEVPREVLDQFHVGTVVVFAASPSDMRPTSSRRAKREALPPASEEILRVAIRSALDKFDPAVGYCRPACGAGVIFAEQMIEQGKELHVVLPFDTADFYRAGVDFGRPDMASWRQRFDRILAKAERHHATTEPFLGDQVLFKFADRFAQGLGLLRAGELGVQAEAIVVDDPQGQSTGGETMASFAKAWRAGTGRDVNRIPAVLHKAGEADMRGAASLRSGDSSAYAPAQRRRHIRSMLFADVKNYSKLQEQHSPAFMAQFLRIVRSVIDACRSEQAPQFTNTWGDGLFLVFSDVVACADFAMRLMDRTVPIMPKLMKLLQDRFDEFAEGEQQFITLPITGATRRKYPRICQRAKVEPWDRFWQTLRQSAEKEMALSFPQYVVSRWIGHSITVSGKHYANSVPDELFDKAAGISAQRQAQENMSQESGTDAKEAEGELVGCGVSADDDADSRENAVTSEMSEKGERGDSNP